MTTKTKSADAKIGKEEQPKLAPAKKEEKALAAPVEAEAKEVKPAPQPPASIVPKPEPQPDILTQLSDIRQTLINHSNQIAEIREVVSRKRKPVNNSKVKIRDKKTGKVYHPQSKNGCYKSLLKAGELTDLVKKGVFGSDPEHNTFGWYALARELPERFEEVKEA